MARTAAQRTRWMAQAAGAGVVLVVAAIVLRRVDLGEVARALGRASATDLVLAAAASLLSLALQSGRWLAIVHPVAPHARARHAFFALVAGYTVGLVVPARAGDLARAHLLSRLSGGSTATYTATAVVDHLLGSVALFGALGFLAAVSPVAASLRGAGTLACAGSVAALIALWAVRPREGSPAPQDAPRGVRGLVRRLRHGLVAVGQPRAVAIAFAFAVAGWSTEVWIASLALRAFDLPSGIAPSLLAVLATTVAAAASLVPGNAGAFELAAVVALSSVGVAREAALAFAIGYHAIHLVPTAALGGGWLLAHGYRMAALRAPT